MFSLWQPKRFTRLALFNGLTKSLKQVDRITERHKRVDDAYEPQTCTRPPSQYHESVCSKLVNISIRRFAKLDRVNISGSTLIACL